LNELETQLELAQRIGFLAQGLHEGLSTELAVLGRQLNALKNNIKD
jgi:four helix bundle protein